MVRGTRQLGIFHRIGSHRANSSMAPRGTRHNTEDGFGQMTDTVAIDRATLARLYVRLRQAEGEKQEANRAFWAQQEELDDLRARTKIAEARAWALEGKCERLQAALAASHLGETAIGLGETARPMAPLPTLIKRLPAGLVSRSEVYQWAISGEIETKRVGKAIHAVPASLWDRAERFAAEKGLRLERFEHRFITVPIAY